MTPCRATRDRGARFRWKGLLRVRVPAPTLAALLVLVAGCAGSNRPRDRELDPSTLDSWRLREAADVLAAEGFVWDWRKNRDDAEHAHAEDDLLRFAAALGPIRAAGVTWTRGEANPGCASGDCTGARHRIEGQSPDLILYGEGGEAVAVVEVEKAGLRIGDELDGWRKYDALATPFYLVVDAGDAERVRESPEARKIEAHVLTYRDPVPPK